MSVGKPFATDFGMSVFGTKPPVAKPLDKRTKPQTSSEKVKTFLPTSGALRAIAIEVLGYSNVGHPGSRHT
jgi:hypothetical protein